MHPGEHEAKNHYDGIKPELINYAEKYLQKIIDGEIKSINIAKDDAERYMKDFKNGILSRTTVEAYGYNYMDYLEGKEK